VGLLVDTFVVRTITVPALAALLGHANWWPAKAITRPGTAAAKVAQRTAVGPGASPRRRHPQDFSGELAASSIRGSAQNRWHATVQRGRRVLRLSVAANSCSGRPVVP
jgi:RND superfamily putative drug exporter